MSDRRIRAPTSRAYRGLRQLRRGASARLRPVVGPLRADLAADPYLLYILILALMVCGFGIWFRVPNFASPDEYSRLIQPMKVAGRVAADPGFGSFRSAITDGRALGATFYLYSVLLLPVFVVVVLSGQLGEFVALGSISSRWDLWHAAPAWFWTSTILLGRLVNVALGVACVYMTYRIGVEFRDRITGRVAALSLALSVGLLSQTHLVGEDIPMLFFLLVTVLIAARYVETGDRRTFMWGCFAGGLAIALKLTGGVAAVVMGVGYLEHARKQSDSVIAFLQPGVIVGGVAVGLLTVFIGIPSAAVAGPDELVGRILNSVSTKTGGSAQLAAPVWFWILRGYVAGMGLPLATAAFAGVAGTLTVFLRRRAVRTSVSILLATTVIVPIAVFLTWEFVRIRHILPTFPAVLVMFGGTVSYARELAVKHDSLVSERVVIATVALVFVASGAFVMAAEAQYVTEPRDGATDWLVEKTDSDATVEVYENSIADVGVPHGRQTIHYAFPEERAANTSSLVLNQTAYTKWMVSMPDRRPDYILLTDQELGYLDPRNPAYEAYPERRDYVAGLLSGEYGYEEAATFRSGPPFNDRTLTERLIEVGTRPTVDGVEREVIILARTD